MFQETVINIVPFSPMVSQSYFVFSALPTRFLTTFCPSLDDLILYFQKKLKCKYFLLEHKALFGEDNYYCGLFLTFLINGTALLALEIYF